MINTELQNKKEPVDTIETEEKLVFALDIGTRSVIGIVGIQDKGVFKVLDTEMIEHTERAMKDGQIEDIDKVAQIAGMVKERLEERLKVTLKRVYVAAAGRALRTYKSTYEMDVEAKSPINKQTISELELNAIDKVHASLQEQDEEHEGIEFYCVGYSVMKYYLDDYPISTLLNHRGKKAKIDIIVTFLPSEVVESLYTAMAKINLDIANLTLEPIAAMNAVIPNELRMLNLALVDIGAGTSDIAISDDGSVTAYTMATVAGDEISEEIIKKYLVDFQTAERIKQELTQNRDTISYTDILGFDYTVSSTKILDTIKPVIENLCNVISNKILEVNGKAPAAVFLVGGGSKIPLMCEYISENLKIDTKKVAVGGNNYMKRIAEGEKAITEPEYATPMGIAITAAMFTDQNGFYVTVNGEKTRLFKNSNVIVMDVLLMSGFKHTQMIGRLGKSISFELNNEKRTIRGGYPENAEIFVNDIPASLSTPVSIGDSITVTPAVGGSDANIIVKEVVDIPQEVCYVNINDNSFPIGMRITVNGVPVSKEQIINNLDVIKTYEIKTLAQLCNNNDIKIDDFSFFVNGKEENGEYILCNGDDIRYYPVAKDKEKTDMPEKSDTKEIKKEDEPEKAKEPAKVQDNSITKNDTEKKIYDKCINVTLNGSPAELPPKSDLTPYLFVDMLNFVDIDPTKPEGNIVLKINGREASYVERVHDGDKVDIYWDKSIN